MTELTMQEAIEAFKAKYPSFDCCYPYTEVEATFKFHSFFYRSANVTRISDGVKGTLGFTNMFGPRIYFGFTPQE
jgi:hypothetical protein